MTLKSMQDTWVEQEPQEFYRDINWRKHWGQNWRLSQTTQESQFCATERKRNDVKCRSNWDCRDWWKSSSTSLALKRISSEEESVNLVGKITKPMSRFRLKLSSALRGENAENFRQSPIAKNYSTLSLDYFIAAFLWTARHWIALNRKMISLMSADTSQLCLWKHCPKVDKIERSNNSASWLKFK